MGASLLTNPIMNIIVAGTLQISTEAKKTLANNIPKGRAMKPILLATISE